MYWGKVIGALAGAITLKPVFVLVGLFLGHQFDRGFVARFQNFREQGETVVGLSDAFVRALFQTMGYLAKIDGRVTEEEIRAARSVMHRIGLGPTAVRHAIAWFNDGKSPSFQLSSTLRELRRESGKQAEARTVFLRLLLEVSMAKPRIEKGERTAIWTICNELGVGRVELAQLEAMIRAQKGFRRSPQGDADSAKLRDAYRTLGIEPAATNAEIKTAYRRLMNKNHPDKIAARNPDDAERQESERRVREVRAAYDLLKARRTIR